MQAFEKQLVPSVEKAMAEMFRQTDATLSAGLTEYARAAGSAATPTVKSLQAALTQARGRIRNRRGWHNWSHVRDGTCHLYLTMQHGCVSPAVAKSRNGVCAHLQKVDSDIW